jgi:glycogen synthase
MKPLRILAVGNMYPPHHQGGYELVWQSVMKLARDRGHEVRILVSNHRDPAIAAPDEPGVHRTLRWYWDWERHEFPTLPIRRRIALERANAAEFDRHLADFRPDVVTWWSMGHMSLSLIERARRERIPAVFSIHNDWLVYSRKADQWSRTWPRRNPLLRAAVERLLDVPTNIDIPAAGRMLFNSQFMLDSATRAGIETSNAGVIHPGIEAKFTQPLPVRPWRSRLLYVGRIDRQKGIDVAVDALAHLPPETQLTICGKGHSQFAEQLRAETVRDGIAERVVFEDFGTTDQVRDAYDDADVVLFPVRWEEPWGLVPLEAMGVARPVVSTARGGTGEFIEDGVNALVIAPDDPQALAAAVTRIASDEALRAQLIEGGRRTAARHTAAEFDRQTLAAIEQAAGRRAA